MKMIFPDGTTYNSQDILPPPPALPPLWRVKHDAEMPKGIWRAGLPEVFPLNGEITPFGKEWQFLTFKMNPGMLTKKWRSLYDYRRAFTNKTGFNNPISPRADYINRLNLSSPLPRWDKTRVCGGATITGTVDGTYLIVEIMDGRNPPPTLEWLLEHPWLYFHAVNSAVDSLGNPIITKFPQGDGRPVLVPLVGHGIAKMPLANLEQVTEIADPYQIKL